MRILLAILAVLLMTADVNAGRWGWGWGCRGYRCRTVTRTVIRTNCYRPWVPPHHHHPAPHCHGGVCPAPAPTPPHPTPAPTPSPHPPKPSPKKPTSVLIPGSDQARCQAEASYMARHNIRGHVGGVIGRFEGCGWSSGGTPGTCTPGYNMRLTGDAVASSQYGTFRVRSWR